MGTDTRPFPPGEYPVIVIGSGPGGLQVSYGLRKHGVPHAVLSADEGAGGMFRKWPFFQRLLSWTKPYAPVDRTSPEYQRYDWNSLLADEPELRSLQAEFMDGTTYYPSRPEMQANLEAFAERAGIAVRYGTRWESTRKEDGPDGTTFVLQTTSGEYRTRLLVLAVGVAEPWSPAKPGIDHARHYADTQAPEYYAGKRLFIIGKQNSGFELASGLSAWASSITVCSPSPAKTALETKSLVGVRARYVQPFEDAYLGLGVRILAASIVSIEHVGDAYAVRVSRTDNGEELVVEADEVIAATGFTCPLLDLPELGVATFGQARLPAVTTDVGERDRPGDLLRGHDQPGLPRHAAARHPRLLGRGARAPVQLDDPRPAHRRGALRLSARSAPRSPRRTSWAAAGDATNRPELWHQKGFLARVITITPEDGIRDQGIVPLVHALDGHAEDLVAMTVEADGTGSIYPMVFVREGGLLHEHQLPGQPLLDFTTPEHVRLLREALADLIPG